VTRFVGSSATFTGGGARAVRLGFHAAATYDSAPMRYGYAHGDCILRSRVAVRSGQPRTRARAARSDAAAQLGRRRAVCQHERRRPDLADWRGRRDDGVARRPDDGVAPRARRPFGGKAARGVGVPDARQAARRAARTATTRTRTRARSTRFASSFSGRASTTASSWRCSARTRSAACTSR
jgi:hypothetical protein